MIETPDNPAARLLPVLEGLRAMQPNTAIPHAMAILLSPETESQGDLARRIGLLISLPDEIANEVEATAEVLSRNVLLRWREPVGKALDAIFFSGGKIDEVCRHYNDGDLVALQLCADLLHRYRREPSLPDSELERITGMVNELLSALEADPDFDDDLRDLLLAHVRAMRQAIQDLPLRGYAGLQETLAATYGFLLLRPDLVARKDTSTTTWQKVTVVLGTIAAALAFGTSTVQALEAASPSPPAEVILIEGAPVSQAPASSGVQMSGTPHEAQGEVEAARVTVPPQG